MDTFSSYAPLIAFLEHLLLEAEDVLIEEKLKVFVGCQWC